MEVRVASGSCADRWPFGHGWAVLPLLALIALLCPGCGPRQSPRLDLLLDVSASTQATRDGADSPLAVVLQAVQRLQSRRPQVVVWQFAQEVSIVYGNRPQQTTDLVPVLRQYGRQTAAGRGTHPARALAALTASWATASEQAFGVVLLTDGESADPAALRRAVAGLAAEPRLRAAWLVGLQPRLRVATERTFAPLGARLLVSSADAVDARSKAVEFARRVREGL
ncbi:MAG: VWA domain-containing protein [Fimbriimonadaceae bacterium]|nr:VWA domain-containing protein [Fimbriimonadaceae bacterium]